MLIGALGDIHGEFDTVRDIMARHPDVAALAAGRRHRDATPANIFLLPLPLYWIKGNNEDFDVIAAAIAGHPPAPNLHYLRNGGCIRSGRGASPRSAARSRRAGTTPRPRRCPPSKGRQTSRAVGLIKLGKSRDDKRRHFVKEEVLACKTLSEHRRVPDARSAASVLSGRHAASTQGRPLSTTCSTAMRPRLHLFGHHHEFTDSQRHGIRSIGLDIVTKSYLLIHAETFRCERLDT